MEGDQLGKQQGAPLAKAGAAPADAAIGQDEIDALLKQAAGTPPAGKTFAESPRPQPSRALPAGSAAGRGAGPTTGDDIDFLLQQAEAALASVDHPVAVEVPGIAPFSLRTLSGSPPSSEQATLELLRDVELNVKIELGRTNMYLEDVLRLRRGSVVTLDKLAGDPVDIYVNGRLVARGEVLVLNDNFCVRVAELVAGENPVAT